MKEASSFTSAKTNGALLKMQMESNDCFLSLLPVERNGGSQGMDSVRCSVSLRAGTFSGSYESVWFCHSDLTVFLDQLICIEAARMGNAALESMSPGEFCFTLRPLDSLGHFAADITLSRLQCLEPELNPVGSSVSACIEVDPSQLKALVDDFRELLLEGA